MIITLMKVVRKNSIKNLLMIKYILLIIVASYVHPVFSQSVSATMEKRKYTTNYNGWYMYMGDHRFNNKLGVHLEAQFRRHDIITQNQQLLLRTGLNYHFTSSTFATLGYCFVNTHPYGEFPSQSQFPEHRIWEQFQFKSMLGKAEIVNRYRLEQRYIYLPVLGSDSLLFEPSQKSTYQNRVRLMTRVSVPFKGKTIENKQFYLAFYDEVFLNFGKNVVLNYIDQNRAYIALGYKIPKLGRLELGYLNQLLVKSDGLKVENNHTLQIGILSNLNFFKEK